MYFPYLRGKQFEIEALLDVASAVYSNTIPIIEPVNFSQRGVPLYRRLVSRNISFTIILNPYHPQSNRLSIATIQGFIDTELAAHASLIVGFIIDQRFNINELNSFLAANPSRNKLILFRNNPLTSDLVAIQSALAANQADYLVFDDTKTNSLTQTTFNTHPQRVLLTDGFQRQDRNSDYPLISTYDSNFNTWRAARWFGIGDYLTIGDFYQDGGGQVYVVSLHISRQTSTGLVVNHFSSTFQSSVQGLSATKFAEANNLLVTNPNVIPLNSSGLDLFRDWNNRSHNPQLGAAKKASIMHHIELMARII